MYNLENPYVNEKLDQVYPVVQKQASNNGVFAQFLYF